MSIPTSVKKKELAERSIEAALDAIAAKRRAPDEGEAHDLAAALGFTAAGMYDEAVAHAERALAPLDQRSPIKHRGDLTRAIDQLRTALYHVVKIGARQ